MKRQLTTFAFAGFLGLCCIGCPPAEQEPVEVDTDTSTEFNEGDIDTGAPVVVEEDSNTTAAEGETTGFELPTEEEVPEEEAPVEEAPEEEAPEEEVTVEEVTEDE